MKKGLKISEIHQGPRGWTKTLLEIYGEDKVRDFWVEHGNRKAAKHFGVSPWTISHCVKKFGWSRPMEKVPHILWGVARGNVHPKNYPHLEFEVPIKDSVLASDSENQKHAYCLLKEGTFIGWCLLNKGNMYCNHIYWWFKGNRKRDWLESYEDLIQAMNDVKSGYFKPQHYKNIDIFYKQYTQTDSELLGKEIKLNKTTSNN